MSINPQSTAWSELQEYLHDGEKIEAIVFGQWGWGEYEGDTYPIPKDKQGQLLPPNDAKPLMYEWKIYGGFGSPECHAMYVWTNQRVIWITQYDGSTRLSSAPRNPTSCQPEIPGG